MKAPNLKQILIFLLLFVSSTMFNTSIYAWMINEDYQQRDARSATDFDIILAGDVRDRITGGGESYITNPFDDPERTIELTEIGNTKIKFSGSNTLPQDLETDRHFGIYGTGTKPKVRFKAWSYATSPYIAPVPKSNFEYIYDPATEQLSITVENLTEDVVTFSDVGYMLSPVERPIEDLVRAVLPPELFTSLPSLNGEYQPGQTENIVISGVNSSYYVVSYATVTFTGESSGNPYNDFGVGTGGEWSQVAVIDQVSGSVPTLTEWGMIVFALLLLAVAAVAIIRRRRARLVGAGIIVFFMLISSDGFAWTRGNHAGEWTAGQTVKVCIDVPPGNQQEQEAFYEAVYEAIAEWNVAQAPFGGLTLEVATENCDINIHWEANRTAWGSTAPGNPVDVTIESNDGLNSRGVTRVLKHELGHAEGLGHSAKSDLMKADAYSSTPGEAPSADDLNSTDVFTEPTKDDSTGKNKMYGTVEELSKSEVSSSANFDEGSEMWIYDYSLFALGGSYIDPVTEFTVELPEGVSETDFSVTQVPPEWFWDVFYEDITGGKPLDEEEASSPTLLSFKAAFPEFGIPPGGTGNFQITSPLGPVDVRSFTNSPHYDSDEFIVVAPAPGNVPTLNEWGMLFLALLLVTFGTVAVIRLRRREAAART